MDLADLVHPSKAVDSGVDGAQAAARGRSGGAAGMSKARRLLREPLVHFLLVGALLIVIEESVRRAQDVRRIVVTPAHVEALANGYALQFGERPDAKTLDALIRSDLHDEILFREGVAEGLDRGDEIVRRRVIQKMQFLMQDLSAPPEPQEADLKAYYRAHAALYAQPARTSFSHIFFSSDRGGDAAALTRARSTLATLGRGVVRAPDKGDPFPDLFDFAAYEPAQVSRIFGRSEFTEATQTQPVGRWGGPYRSAYGWHLLYVSARADAAAPPFEAVRDRVRADALQAAQESANRAAFERLARGFTVIRADASRTP